MSQSSIAAFDNIIEHAELGKRYASEGDFVRAKVEVDYIEKLLPYTHDHLNFEQKDRREVDQRRERQASIPPGYWMDDYGDFWEFDYHDED